MKPIVLVAALCIAAIPCMAQAPAPTPTPVPTAAPEPATQPDMPAWEPEEVEARGNPPLRDRLYFGGGLGLSFGDVDYIELSPLVGFRVTPDFNLGAGVFYRYRKDSRYEDDVTTNDYGGSLFAQYQLVPNLFLHGEAEYLDYEYVLGNLDTDRESDTNLLAGAGYGWPVGGSAFYILMLYNFNYDETSYANPYDSPWVFRVGVTF